MAHGPGIVRNRLPRRRLATHGRGSRPPGGHREGDPPGSGRRLPLAGRTGQRPCRGERGRDLCHVHRPRERDYRPPEDGAEGTADERQQEEGGR